MEPPPPVTTAALTPLPDLASASASSAAAAPSSDPPREETSTHRSDETPVPCSSTASGGGSVVPPAVGPNRWSKGAGSNGWQICGGIEQQGGQCPAGGVGPQSDSVTAVEAFSPLASPAGTPPLTSVSEPEVNVSAAGNKESSEAEHHEQQPKADNADPFAGHEGQGDVAARAPAVCSSSGPEGMEQPGSEQCVPWWTCLSSGSRKQQWRPQQQQVKTVADYVKLPYPPTGQEGGKDPSAQSAMVMKTDIEGAVTPRAESINAEPSPSRLTTTPATVQRDTLDQADPDLDLAPDSPHPPGGGGLGPLPLPSALIYGKSLSAKV